MTIQQVIDNTKEEIKSLTGAKLVTLKYHLSYGDGVSKIDVLKNAICQTYGITWKVIEKKCREAEIAAARQMFSYFATDVLGMGLVRVGRILGQDHTTVLYGRNKVRDFIDIEDPETLDKIRLINEYLNN